MCLDAKKHEELAHEITLLFRSRCVELSVEDFGKVARVLGFELLPVKPRSGINEYYEKLSVEERADLDFIMHM